MAKQLFIGLGVLGAICGLAVVIICLLNTEIALYVNLSYAFFIGHFNRLFFDGNLPFGVFSDILIWVTFLSLFFRRVNMKQNLILFTRTSVVKTLLILYGYMAIELFNPNANSFDGWFQAFRRILDTLILLFSAFVVFDSIGRVQRFIKVLFVLGTITAIYGCIQRWHGLFPFEIDWVMKDPQSYAQMFRGGEYRIMSTFIEPDSFSFVMGACSVFFIGMIWTYKQFWKQIIVTMGIVFMILALGFTGIRTAYAMVIAGVGLFILLTFNRKKTQVFTVVALIGVGGLIAGPFYSLQVRHLRTIFAASKDESYKVRENNRQRIQPYIYDHPIGGGLGTSGTEGLTFNPGHYLAGFPPDSGALKKALEIGWIGFGIIMVLYFLILKNGIHGYFSAKDDKVKLIYAASTATCFAFYLADYAQVAIGQITDVVVYYPLIAIILKLNILTNSNQS